MFNMLWTAKLFSKAATILHFHQQFLKVPVSLPPCQPSFYLWFWPSKWYVIVDHCGFICNSLRNYWTFFSCVYWPLMCLLNILCMHTDSWSELSYKWFLLICVLLFHFYDNVFKKATDFRFMKSSLQIQVYNNLSVHIYRYILWFLLFVFWENIVFVKHLMILF